MDDRTFFYAIVCGPLYIGALLGLWLIVAPGAALKWRAKILKDKQRGRVASGSNDGSGPEAPSRGRTRARSLA